MTGRQVKPKPEFVFSNGNTVLLNRIGPMISLPIYKRIPRPTPPTNTVEVAPDKFETIENPSHPDYLAAVAAWEMEIAMATQDAMLELGVASESIDIDHDQCDEIRAYFGFPSKDAGGPSDKILWIKYAICGGNDDLRRFGTALREYDKPSESGVSAAEATFPRLVSREQPGTDPDEATE